VAGLQQKQTTVMVEGHSTSLLYLSEPKAKDSRDHSGHCMALASFGYWWQGCDLLPCFSINKLQCR